MAISRLDGPAVGQSVRDSRRSFNALLNEYDKACENLFRRVLESDYGRPTLKQLPLPDLLMQATCSAQDVIAAEGSEHYNRVLANFHHTVQATLDSVGSLM